MGQGRGKKIVLTFLIVLVFFSILIIVHEFGHMLMAKRVGVKVERFSLGLGKKVFGIKRGGTEYVISAFPFGGYVKLAGDNPVECKGTADEFFSKSPLKRFLVIIGGPFTNYIFAFVLFTAIFMIGVPSLTTRVGRLLPDYPAQVSGVKEGDLIFEIDGKEVVYWEDLVGIVQKDTRGIPLKFKVKRRSRILTFWIAPKVIKTKNIFGQETTVGMIGIAPKEEIIFVKHNLLEAVTLGGKRLIALTNRTYKGLWLLITGGLPVRESLTGPIGIAFLIGEAAKLGIVHLLSLMAYINIALAVFNLLPFPILDGGHILFLAVEKLRGKPLSVRTQETVSQVALYILIAFALFVTWNDITKFLPFMRK
ncbi:MAG: RIP metalloprotease RseP [Candidatus Omnitrophica bacterium]|nr:RIP metalloprotease RseP [Candidatus Omnitrophota bacterium]